jgi:hypothetical protein
VGSPGTSEARPTRVSPAVLVTAPAATVTVEGTVAPPTNAATPLGSPPPSGLREWPRFLVSTQPAGIAAVEGMVVVPSPAVAVEMKHRPGRVGQRPALTVPVVGTFAPASPVGLVTLPTASLAHGRKMALVVVTDPAVRCPQRPRRWT